MSAITLDSGALIAYERGEERITALLDRCRAVGISLVVPAPVLAQVWRDRARQVAVNRLASAATVISLDVEHAKRIGARIAACGHEDVVDVHVAVIAHDHGGVVISSDYDDLAKIDPTLLVMSPQAEQRQ